MTENKNTCAARLSVALIEYTADSERAKAQLEIAQSKVDSLNTFIAKLDFLINKTLDIIEDIKT